MTLAKQQSPSTRMHALMAAPSSARATGKSCGTGSDGSTAPRTSAVVRSTAPRPRHAYELPDTIGVVA